MEIPKVHRNIKLRPVFFSLIAVLIGFFSAQLLSLESGKKNESALLGQAEDDSPLIAPNIFVRLAKKVVPSVVNISITAKRKNSSKHQSEDIKKFLEEFFGKRKGPQDDEGAPQAHSLGTGFIIDEEGLILTNHHVVGEASEIKIHFTEDQDEVPVEGKVVGIDPDLDLALIKVETDRKLTPLKLGDSDLLEVGEYVVAVGNPFGRGHSVTHGIISAKHREAPDFPLARYIQTDAPINPGNSGGPLVNLRGEVIGINNAVDARAQGIGFAIPINLVKSVLSQLKIKGTVSRGYIGVLINNLSSKVAKSLSLDPKLKAPIVVSVYPGEPADRAGMKPYDVVTHFDGKRVKSVSSLIRAVTAVEVGKSAPVKVIRDGKEIELSLTVSERPTQSNRNQKVQPNENRKQPHTQSGLELEPLTPDLKEEFGLKRSSKGVVVSRITQYGGPADRAGLSQNDVILEVNRKPVESVEDFHAKVKEPGLYLIRTARQLRGSDVVYQILTLEIPEPKK